MPLRRPGKCRQTFRALGRHQDITGVKCRSSANVKTKQMLNAGVRQTPRQMTATFPGAWKTPNQKKRNVFSKGCYWGQKVSHYRLYMPVVPINKGLQNCLSVFTGQQYFTIKTKSNGNKKQQETTEAYGCQQKSGSEHRNGHRP